MKVTICELPDTQEQLKVQWEKLKAHVSIERTELLLLPEMPFSTWLPIQQEPIETSKIESLLLHQQWLSEVESLDCTFTVYSAPEMLENRYINSAFIYSKGAGHRRLHSKVYLPQEENFYEDSWFDRPPIIRFEAFDLGTFRVGVLLCTDLWFLQHAREYGKQDVDLLLCPRATGQEDTGAWLNCGKTAAVVSGAFCLSSNRSGTDQNGYTWGGNGWIASPVNGSCLTISSTEFPWKTIEIDLQVSRDAKKEYPLYLKSEF